MMQTIYQTVFRLSVKHAYFKDGICDTIRFQPDAATVKVFARFNFIIRKTPDGLLLCADVKSSVSELLNYIVTATGTSFFMFQLITGDASFDIITELPVNSTGKLVYDTQSALNVQEADGLLLNASFSAQGNSGYTGSLTIHYADMLCYGTENEPATFSIRYEARSTQWQYYVIKNTQIFPGSLSIPEKAGIHFSDPVNTIIEGGRQALLFSSAMLIPLQEEPGYRFDLVCHPDPGSKRSTAKTIYKGLPNPGPQYFGLVQVNDITRISSPMYVYV